jgi:hypothetical protein
MIRQALVNLLENAARHDPGPLEVRAARGGCFLGNRVIDHGPGDPGAERQRVFEAFQRLREHTVNADRSGSVGRTPDLRDAAVAGGSCFLGVRALRRIGVHGLGQFEDLPREVE